MNRSLTPVSSPSIVSRLKADSNAVELGPLRPQIALSYQRKSNDLAVIRTLCAETRLAADEVTTILSQRRPAGNKAHIIIVERAIGRCIARNRFVPSLWDGVFSERPAVDFVLQAPAGLTGWIAPDPATDGRR